MIHVSKRLRAIYCSLPTVFMLPVCFIRRHTASQSLRSICPKKTAVYVVNNSKIHGSSGLIVPFLKVRDLSNSIGRAFVSHFFWSRAWQFNFCWYKLFGLSRLQSSTLPCCSLLRLNFISYMILGSWLDLASLWSWLMWLGRLVPWTPLLHLLLFTPDRVTSVRIEDRAPSSSYNCNNVTLGLRNLINWNWCRDFVGLLCERGSPKGLRLASF